MVCDDTMSKWSIHALEQADIILIVVNFLDEAKEPKGIEKKILEMKFKTTRELVFLHNFETTRIHGTSEWLKHRSGYHMHFHIRCKETFFQSNYIPSQANSPRDHFARLARFLTENAIGHAFGGGGARGYAHIGLLKIFNERNFPIDMISGASMGAFVGSLQALNENQEFVEKTTKEWATVIILNLSLLYAIFRWLHLQLDGFLIALCL